jgi:hypothetical protein
MAASAASTMSKPIKFYQKTKCFGCNWETTALALWKRYPNPHSKHVLSEDVVTRRLSGGKLFTRRLMSKMNSIRPPKWAEWIVKGASNVFITEESVVDPINKTFVTYTRNITLTKLSSVEEKCEFYVDPSDASRTCLTKSAWFKSNIHGFSRPIEHFLKERYQKNADKAEQGLLYVIERLITPNFPAIRP